MNKVQRGRVNPPATGSTPRPAKPEKPTWADMVKRYQIVPDSEFYPPISKYWAELAKHEPRRCIYRRQR